jgi:hypothetical protein
MKNVSFKLHDRVTNEDLSKSIWMYVALEELQNLSEEKQEEVIALAEKFKDDVENIVKK